MASAMTEMGERFERGEAYARAGGAFILSSGCEIPPLAPIANVRAMVEAADQHGRYH